MTPDITPNPLLDFSGPTRFDAILPQHIVPAVDELLARARSAVDSVASVVATPT